MMPDRELNNSPQKEAYLRESRPFLNTTLSSFYPRIWFFSENPDSAIVLQACPAAPQRRQAGHFPASEQLTRRPWRFGLKVASTFGWPGLRAGGT